MKRTASILFVVLPIIAIALVMYQIVISNELATLGKDLSRINAEFSTQNDRHELLATEVASTSSFLVMRNRAESLGFQPPSKDQIIALTLESPVALKVTLP